MPKNQPRQPLFLLSGKAVTAQDIAAVFEALIGRKPTAGDMREVEAVLRQGQAGRQVPLD